LQAKRIKAAARTIGRIKAHSTAFRQAVHAGIVSFKAALNEHALGTKAGLYGTQAFAGQITIARMVTLTRAVQVGPTIIAIAAVMHCLGLLGPTVTAFVVVDDGTNCGNRCDTEYEFSNIVTVHPLGLHGGRANQSK